MYCAFRAVYRTALGRRKTAPVHPNAPDKWSTRKVERRLTDTLQALSDMVCRDMIEGRWSEETDRAYELLLKEGWVGVHGCLDDLVVGIPSEV